MNIISVLSEVFSITNLGLSLFGVFAGIIFGCLPGFSAAMGISVLLPITFGMNSASGLILLGALYCGAMYGGSISAILINTPGTPGAAATVLDGNPMAKKGFAGQALNESITASFFGGIFGAAVLLLLAPPLAKVSLMFGPPEYLLLAIFGLTIIASISKKAMIKGLISGGFGLVLAMIGTDPLLGVPRFTMGIINLVDGIELIPALIGFFAIPEVFNIINSYDPKEKRDRVVNIKNIKIGFPRFKHIISFMPIYLKSSAIGTFIGMLPGAGGSIASFLSYNETKRASKNSDKFGTGIPEGVAAAEASNNAVVGGSLIPMLTLGIPGNSVTAILMGGLMIHGLQPGGALFATNGDVVYTFIIALFLANVFMLFMGLYAAPYFTLVNGVKKHILAVFIILFTFIGSFALRNSMFDVYVMLICGIVGYILKFFKFDLIPIVLGLILGKFAENGFNQTMSITQGENVIGYIITRPISIILIILILSSFVLPSIMGKIRKV